MYVCMSVRYVFTSEIYGFMHSLHTFLARDAHDAITRAIEVKDPKDRSQCQNESRDMEDG